jgi:hypothetical protein
MSKIEKKLDSIQRILKLAIEITNNTKADVFVEYSGHINCISIRAYWQGWIENTDWDYAVEVYFDIYSEEVCEKQLQGIINKLEEVQKNGDMEGH